MPRRRIVQKREVLPDPIYNSVLLQQFINSVMRKGKKSLAEGIVYTALDQVKRKANDDPLKVFKKAIDNIKPALEVKSRRVGGSTYQVPVEVNTNRRVSLALRWLISYATARPERPGTETPPAYFPKPCKGGTLDAESAEMLGNIKALL